MKLQNKTREELVLLGQSILNCPSLQIIHPIEEFKDIVQLAWEHYEYSTKFPFFIELLYFKGYKDDSTKIFNYQDLLKFKAETMESISLCDIMCN